MQNPPSQARTFMKRVNAMFDKCVLQEASLLSSLSHPNIVKLVNVVKVTCGEIEELRLRTEYAGRDYAQLLRSQLIPSSMARHYIVQLLSACSYIHQLGVYHLDIKPANVVIDLKKQKLTLIDFGSSRRVDTSDEFGLLPTATFRYIPPEHMKTKSYPVARADEWGVGHILYSLITGKPLVNIAQIPKNYEDAVELEYNFYSRTDISLNLHEFTDDVDLIVICEGLLQWNPKDRISCDDALRILGHDVVKASRREYVYRKLQRPLEIRWVIEKLAKSLYPENHTCLVDNTVRLFDDYLSSIPSTEDYESKLTLLACFICSTRLYQRRKVHPQVCIQITRTLYTSGQIFDRMQMICDHFNYMIDRL